MSALRRIAIITSGHFCTNPRVWKEADALADAGYDVTVIGNWYDPRQADLDLALSATRPWKHRVAADLRGKDPRSSAARLWYRLRTRVGKHRVDRGGGDAHSLGYATDKLCLTAQRVNADLTIGHLEQGLWAVRQLHRMGHVVGADFEDWHSENYPDGTIPHNRRRFYRDLESGVARVAKHLSAPSRAMALALARDFEVRQPTVIYNGVSRQTEASGKPLRERRLIWFSQTVGRGRGLEDVLSALPRLRGEWHLELVGNPSFEGSDWITARLPNHLIGRVTLKPAVPPDQLGSLVAACDIGLALEIPDCRNKDLTASNKVIQYLQSGLTVVASDTAGQREVLEMIPGAGHLYRSGDIDGLVERLNRLLAEPRPSNAAREAIAERADCEFGYEGRRRQLLASIERAFDQHVVTG